LPPEHGSRAKAGPRPPCRLRQKGERMGRGGCAGPEGELGRRGLGRPTRPVGRLGWRVREKGGESGGLVERLSPRGIRMFFPFILQGDEEGKEYSNFYLEKKDGRFSTIC